MLFVQGYGMVLPPFPPASYVEAPGYILPHAQLHMVDYRRMMAPHLAPTMAYQARRFRYQQTPSGRVLVNSEVQTEPISVDPPQQGYNTVTSSSESGRSTDSSVLSSPKPNEDKTTCPKKGCTIAEETTRIPAIQNGGILFQAEEVRIECSGSPSAVKITRSKETTELASNADGELLQCKLGTADDVVLSCFQPVPFEDEERKGTKDLSHLEEPCPDIVMVSCPSNGSVSTLEGSIVEPVNSTLVVQGDPSLVKSAQDVCGNPKNIHFKILRLPLDLQCLDELRQMEASVWSVESLMPYVPTSEWIMQNSLMTPGKASLAPVMEIPAENPVQPNQSPADARRSLLEAGTVIELDGQDSMTSLESLPPFLPSASRLADFGNAYYNKLSSNVQKISNSNWTKGHPEAHQDKVQSGHQSPNATPKKLKEETTSRSVVSGVVVSEQKHCTALFPESPLKHKVRMCKSCSVKRGADPCSSSPSSKAGWMKRHKISHARLTGVKVKVPLCATCMGEKKARRKVAASTVSPKSNMSNEMSEASENEAHLSKKCSKLYYIQNPHSGKHLEKCPVSHQPKLREQNCSYEDMKTSHSTSAWNSNGHSQHKDLTWEGNEENLALSALEQLKDTEQRFTSGRIPPF